MAKSGIKFLYANGGPESVTRIDCLSSSPGLKGTIILTPFVNLTSFKAGNNGLQNVIGYQGLTALKSFEIQGGNAVPVNLSALPVNLEIFSNRCCGTVTGNINILPINLTYYDAWGQNFTTGDIGTLPSGLTYFVNRGDPGSNTTSGNIANLPGGLLVYDNRGNNITNGDIGSLPSGLVYYLNTGSNTTSGDIGSLKTNTPNLTSFANYGFNTTVGNISSLPFGLIVYDNRGYNTTTGDVSSAPSSLLVFETRGFNTLSGDINNLPPNITDFECSGNNTITGNITAVKNDLTWYLHSGQNTVSATTLNLKTCYPNVKTFIHTGFGMLSGDFKDLPTSLEYFDARAYNTMQGHFSALPATLKTFYNWRTTATPNVTCDTTKMPPILEDLDMRGGGFTVFGDVAGLPKTLRIFIVGFGSPKAPTNVNGINTNVQVSGNVIDLPRNMTNYLCDTAGNGIICNFVDLPRSLISFIVRGKWDNIGAPEDPEFEFVSVNPDHRFFGDLKELPRSLINCAMGSLSGDFVYGNLRDLPKNIIYFTLGGNQNTITGKLEDIPSSVTTSFTVDGKNTITGDLSGIAKTMGSFDVRGNNTISGSLTSLSAENLTYFTVEGNNQIYSYYDGTGGNYQGIKWGNNRGGMLRIGISPALKNDLAGMPQEHLVTLLVDLCGSNWAASSFRYCTFNVNQPAIFYSLYPEASAAVKSISDRGIPVTVNAISATPTFYRDFAKYKTLNHGGSLSGAPITFTRNSSATYFDANGVLQVVNVNVPRFDHDPVTGESKGLLIEETAVNYLTASEMFNSWVKDWTTVVSNTAIAPNGQMVADKIIVEPVYSNHRIIQSTTSMPPASAIITLSVFAKAGEKDTIRLSVRDSLDTTKSILADYNLTDGEVVLSTGTNLTASNLRNAYVQEINNGWYRCVLNGIPSVNSLNRSDCTIGIVDEGNAEYRPEFENTGLYVWGAQLERVIPEIQNLSIGLGDIEYSRSYIIASSYIPTTTTLNTKIQDYAVVTSTVGIINVDEGTFIAKAYSPMEGYGVPLSAGENWVPNLSGQAAVHRRILKVSDDRFQYTGGPVTFGRAGKTYARASWVGPNNNIFKEENNYLVKICHSYKVGQTARNSANNKQPEPLNVPIGPVTASGFTQTVMTIGSDLSGSVSQPGELNTRVRYLNGHVCSVMHIPQFFTQQQVTSMSI